jgi:hypothetical protein
VNITTCAFLFELQNVQDLENTTEFTFYPSGVTCVVDLKSKEPVVFHTNLLKGSKKVLVKVTSGKNLFFKTNIVIQCVDNVNCKIAATFVESSEILKKSSSKTAFIVHTSKFLSIDAQKSLVNSFNNTFNDLRNQYGSLILPYFLGFCRKMLPFSYAFALLVSIIKESSLC